MEPLGRLFDVVTSATTTASWVSLRQSREVAIVLIGATSGNATIQIAQDASGTGAVNFDGAAGHGDGITVYWTRGAAGSGGTWTKHTQAAAATITAATGGLAVCFVAGYQVPDGFDYVNASHASGSFLLLPADLNVQRRPSSLTNVTV